MARGGKRPGAGRKANSGKYGEPTVVKRIPLSRVADIEQFMASDLVANKESVTFSSGLKTASLQEPLSDAPSHHLPFFASRVAAGFPSPADDFLEASLDLNHYLVAHPAATFFVRASGDSMIQAGIHDNDILVVDRSMAPKNGAIVIAVVNGELTVKRLHIEVASVTLMPENPHYPPLAVTGEMEFTIWGVVTSVIHQFKGGA